MYFLYHIYTSGVIDMSLARHTERAESSHIHKSYLSDSVRTDDFLSVHRFTSFVLVGDLTFFIVSGVIPALLHDGISSISVPQYLSAIVIGTLIFVLTSWISNDYSAEHFLEWHRTIRKVLVSLFITYFVLVLAGIATKVTEDYSRVWFYSWILSSVITIVLVRSLLLASAEAKLAKGKYLQRALMVSCMDNSTGNDQPALETDNRIRIVGTVAARHIDSVPDLGPYIRQFRPQIIILNLPWSQIDAAINKLKSLSHYALEVLVLPESSACIQRAIRLRRLGRQTLLQVMEPPLAARDQEKKRVLDVIVASLALFLSFPLLLLIALAIKLESKGPVLFKQMRVGFNGDLIEVWKFRSMYVADTDPHASRQTSKDDPRVTRIGHFIRRTSIDELPQFWNVLQGQMSVVGPRPHALKTSADGEALETIVDEYMARHRVKPGITGWAQINGARGELRSREQLKRRVDFDLYYIEHWSVYLDIKIILTTVMKVLYDPRAY
jgi:Undecaprenyl-phosphate glucose phosphotransferase